ncbi:histidine phosphatase family protein [Hydrogenophaga sp. RWCD_12]|uniref:histidine phosphatase family protein n=1 Tax=Hydrogenophaga sp. RWCD_12 TaxID=3391190 RepID=UPI003985125C
MPFTLLVARHGQTDLNIDERWQGRLDLPLNATGQAQARQLARDLPAGIDAIVASPMQRARQTAEPAAQRWGLPVSFDADFRERDFGVFEGLTEAEAAVQFPELIARPAAYRWDEEPPGAESTRAVVDRVARGLQRLREQHEGRTVLLVSHGFVVRCLRFLIDGVNPADFFTAPRIPNGSLLTRQLP